MSLEIPQSPFGVLSPDEELALSFVREILGKICAEGQMVDITLLEGALAGAGTSIECGSPWINVKVFRMRDARFFVQSCSGQPETVELIFIEINQ